MAVLFKAKSWVSWHNTLGWWSLAAILIWVLSGASHPLMSWLGPKSQSFFPPSMHLTPRHIEALSELLSSHSLPKNASLIKVVPSDGEPVLQISKNLSSPKEYFSLSGDGQLMAYDQRQAAWLGTHYTGRAEDEIADIQLISEFSSDYPWVNRLLPVYKIRYVGSDKLTAFVHTETAALASLSNTTKASMQWFFQNAHTFRFLNSVEWGRLVIVGLFVLTLALMAGIGLGLVFLLKPRKIKEPKRRYHRLLSYVLWLPLLAWSASGFYHLLQSSLIESTSGLRLGDALSMDQSISTDTSWISELQNQTINSVSLIEHNHSVYYRVSVSPEAPSEPVTRMKKYRGMSTEKKSVYVNANTGVVDLALTDNVFAKRLALKFSGLTEADVEDVRMVTRFGPHYDFRNKRLPVWQVAFKDREGLNLFIDPTMGLLVDQSRRVDRVERWSFSNLHKWSFMNPVTGRFWRDVLILLTLSLLLLISAFGALLLIKKQNSG